MNRKRDLNLDRIQSAWRVFMLPSIQADPVARKHAMDKLCELADLENDEIVARPVGGFDVGC